MKKVTRKACAAFVAGQYKRVDNTESFSHKLCLFGNDIAIRRKDGSIEATLAGYGTVTTRERLNGLCELLGLPRMFSQRKGLQRFGDVEIGTHDWIVLTGPDAHPEVAKQIVRIEEANNKWKGFKELAGV